MIIRQYGLLKSESFIFLHEQGDEGRCLNPGLAKFASPFIVRVPHWLRCPHRLSDPQEGPALDHPFVRAMGPDQEGKLFHVEPKHHPWIVALAGMCPTYERFVEPWWALRRPRMLRVEPKLTLTNACPLVITDWGPEDFGDMERLVSMPRTRNLILCGPIKLPKATVLRPRGLRLDHDWRTEGARQLYHLIRRST